MADSALRRRAGQRGVVAGGGGLRLLAGGGCGIEHLTIGPIQSTGAWPSSTSCRKDSEFSM